MKKNPEVPKRIVHIHTRNTDFVKEVSQEQKRGGISEITPFSHFLHLHTYSGKVYNGLPFFFLGGGGGGGKECINMSI